MITDAMKPYETTNVYIASPPSERELMLEVRKHLESGGFRVRTMHESEIAYRAAYPNCDYLKEMFEGKFLIPHVGIICHDSFYAIHRLFQTFFQQLSKK